MKKKHLNKTSPAGVISRILPCIALLLISGGQAAAQTFETDLQAWQIFNIQGPLGDSKLVYYGETQLRTGSGISEPYLFMLFPALGYRFSDEAIAWIGYGRVEGLGFGDVDEDRVFEQLTWDIPSADLDLNLRLRVEQRSFSNSDDLAWRYRSQLRARVPFTEKKDWAVLLMDEILVPSAGDVQNRFVVGLTRRFSKHLILDAGVMFQTRQGSANQVLATNLSFRP